MENIDYSLVISLVSLAGTIFTFLFYDGKIKKQEKELNKYQLKKNHEEEQDIKKANLRANIYQTGRNKKLKIYNQGQAKARNINVKFDKDYKYFISENPFPVEFIHPQGFQEITLSIHKGTPDRFGVVITWDDDYASGRTFKDYIQTF